MNVYARNPLPVNKKFNKSSDFRHFNELSDWRSVSVIKHSVPRFRVQSMRFCSDSRTRDLVLLLILASIAPVAEKAQHDLQPPCKRKVHKITELRSLNSRFYLNFVSTSLYQRKIMFAWLPVERWLLLLC